MIERTTSLTNTDSTILPTALQDPTLCTARLSHHTARATLAKLSCLSFIAHATASRRCTGVRIFL